ncbi:hypothetical protein PAAL109150_07140 [Paenibacillus alkaliterrae]
MRKAKYQWKRESRFGCVVQGSGVSAVLGILFLVGLIGGIIADLIFHTGVTLAIIGIIITVVVGIFYPSVLLIAVVILIPYS